jgi:hypothetical protein
MIGDSVGRWQEKGHCVTVFPRVGVLRS